MNKGKQRKESQDVEEKMQCKICFPVAPTTHFIVELGTRKEKACL